MKHVKKCNLVLSILVIMGVFMFISTTSSAENSSLGTASLRWQNFAQVSGNIAVDGSGGVTMNGYARTYGSATISGEITLQKKSGSGWQNVRSFSDSTNGKSLDMRQYTNVSERGSYRVSFTATANGETVTTYSSTANY